MRETRPCGWEEKRLKRIQSIRDAEMLPASRKILADKAAKEAERRRGYALEKIRKSSLVDFGDALEWAQWCRDIAAEVAPGDEE